MILEKNVSFIQLLIEMIDKMERKGRSGTCFCKLEQTQFCILNLNFLAIFSNKVLKTGFSEAKRAYHS